MPLLRRVAGLLGILLFLSGSQSVTPVVARAQGDAAMTAGVLDSVQARVLVDSLFQQVSQIRQLEPLRSLDIVVADRAYFGEKDWQQYVLVRDMAAAFFLGTEIVPCPVVREPDGLAMSSRNVHLAPDERAVAPEFHRILASRMSTTDMERALVDAGFGIDYVERRDGRVLGAVRLGKVRLIDNVKC